MKAPGMNLVVELHTSLVATGELLWNPGIPKIVHVEAHHALPIDTGLAGQRVEEGHLASSGGEDHPDLFLPFQQFFHLRADIGSSPDAQVLGIVANDHPCLSISQYFTDHCHLLNEG